MRLAFLVAACVVLSVSLAAQTAIFDTISVDSTASDAVDIAGGIVLGVDLSAEDGGVPERGIIFFNATDCPSPLVAYPLPFNSGGLLGLPVCAVRVGIPRECATWKREVAMRQTIKGVIIGAVVAAGVSVLLAQSATWTTPRNWATDDLLTAADFNAQFRDNLLWLRQDAQLTGTDALTDLGCGTLGTNEVLFSDCTWATIPAGVRF